MRRALATLLPLAFASAVIIAPAAGAGPFTRATTSAPAPSAMPPTASPAAVPVCGSIAAGSSGPVPTPTAFAQGFEVGDFAIAGGVLSEIDGVTVRRYDLSSGRRLAGFSVAPTTVQDLAVSPAGDIAVAAYPYSVVQYTAGGAKLWSRDLAHQITGIYGTQTPGGWRIAVTTAGDSGRTLIDDSGNVTGTDAVAGNLGAPTPTGGLVTTDGRYVHEYAADGTPTLTVGDSHVANDPMPSGGALHFYQQGGAVVAPDGAVLVADAQHGIEVVRTDGTLAGTVPDAALGGLTERSPMAVVGDQLWFATGPRFTTGQSIVHASLTALEASATTAAQPRLGFGAGITTGTVDSYVSPGGKPAVSATFDPWWQADAGLFTLQTTVRTWRQVLAEASGTVTVTPLSAAALARSIPVTTPSTPGDTEIDARLLDHAGLTVGATCLQVAVGAPGDTLDFSTLPAGAGYGGPGPSRDVALQGVLGTGLTRVGVDWARLLPGGAASSAPIDVSSYLADFTAAADRARQGGTRLELQVGQGGAVEKALVSNGTWGARVKELVQDLHSTGIAYWEAWNEPNNTYGSPARYTADVLAPFYAAVRSADPAAKVVGGTVCGMDLGYWQGLIAAGALSDLDIAAIHPYPGHNRAPEEQGLPASLATLRQMLTSAGRPDLPVWDTENSYWSDGTYNWLTSADTAVHQELWFKALGVSAWSYFEPEGAWGDDGVTYSAIQFDDAVKPTALALMASKTVLAGRQFLAMVDTGTPHVYAERLGPTAAGGDDLVALWTDSQDTNVEVGGQAGTGVHSTDEYGAADDWVLTSAPGLVTATSAVRYLEIGHGVPLNIGPVEASGTDLAVGGSAAATSEQGSNTAALAIDGDDTAANGGDWPGTPAWASADGDVTPVLTLHLRAAAVVDRILLSTPSLASVVPGLRDWDVAIRPNASAPWTTVASPRNRFYQRNTEVQFPPQLVSDVRITVDAVDITGYAGGARPAFVPASTYEPAIIDEVRVYAPGLLTPGLPTPDLLPAGGVVGLPAPLTSGGAVGLPAPVTSGGVVGLAAPVTGGSSVGPSFSTPEPVVLPAAVGRPGVPLRIIDSKQVSRAKKVIRPRKKPVSPRRHKVTRVV